MTTSRSIAVIALVGFLAYRELKFPSAKRRQRRPAPVELPRFHNRSQRTHPCRSPRPASYRTQRLQLNLCPQPDSNRTRQPQLSPSRQPRSNRSRRPPCNRSRWPESQL